MEFYLKKIRTSKDFTISELSRLTKAIDPNKKGVSVSYLSECESGKYTNISLEKL